MKYNLEKPDLTLLLTHFTEEFSLRIFNIINYKLDTNQLTPSQLKLASEDLTLQVKKNLIADHSCQYLYSLNLAKQQDIERLLSDYIQHCAKFFAHSEPSKKAFAEHEAKFREQFSDQLSMKTDEEKTSVEPANLDSSILGLTGNEKKYILTTCHNSYFPTICDTIVQKKASGRTSLFSIEEIIEDNKLLQSEFHSLRAFEEIKNLRSKKLAIQEVIKTYLSQLISVSQLNETSASLLIAQINNALGQKLSADLFKAIKMSLDYPTPLEMLENVSSELRDKIRGIDLFTNSPISMEPTPFTRQTCSLINEALKNPDEKKPKQAKNTNQQNAFFQDQSSSSASRKPFAATSQQKTNAPLDFFGSINSIKNDMHSYKLKMDQYRTVCINTNKKSNFDLFNAIANHEQITPRMLGHSQLILIKDSFQNSALQLAVLCGNIQAYHQLMKYNFPLDEVNDADLSLLQLGILGGNEDIVKALLQLDIEQNHTTNGDTMLNFALMVSPQNSEIPSLLIQSAKYFRY